MRMNHLQIQALSRFIEPIRPDREFHGIKANLEKLDLSWDLAAWIAIQCAADPTAKTPGAMSNPIYRTGSAPEPVSVVPSIGRDNVIRLRREQATLADTAASSERIAAIRALSKFPRKPQEDPA
jgi:hypothetical protein